MLQTIILSSHDQVAYCLPDLMNDLMEFPLLVAVAFPPRPTTKAVITALFPPKTTTHQYEYNANVQDASGFYYYFILFSTMSETELAFYAK